MKLTAAHGWFVCGAAVAFAVWGALWPGQEDSQGHEESDARRERVARSIPSPAAVLAELEAADTGERKLMAATRLEAIPVEEIPALLEEMDLAKNWRLSFAARALLIRWGSKDGPAAMTWAWQRLGTCPAWDQAFREIGPAWAWRNPETFGAWVQEALDRWNPGSNITAAMAESSEVPLLESGQISRALRWLLPGKPSVAFRILKSRTEVSSDDTLLADSLRTVEQVREALSVFEQIEPIDPAAPRPAQYLSISLLQRWKELDPEDFARSPYQGFIRRTVYQEADDAIASWKAAPPGERVARADAMIENPSRILLDYGLPKMVNEWVATDVAGAAAWLESRPEANLVYAREISLADPGRAFRRIATLPPAASGAAMAAAFESWSTNRPGERPDMAEWTASQRQAWEDLGALMAE